MSEPTNAIAHGTRVVVGRIGPTRRCGARPAGGEAAASSIPAGPPRAVRLLALAISIQQAIDRGEIRDLADAARRLGLSRARLTQIGDLALLSPRIQEALLMAADGDGVLVSEQDLRGLLRLESWPLQDAVWPGMVAARGSRGARREA